MNDRPLRVYQITACDRVMRELVELQRRSTILVMATGTGKTRTAGEILRRWRTAGRGRILWLAHRSELLTQARDAIRENAGLTCGIEQADQAVDRARLPDVVCASVATLRGDRLREFPRDSFSLVVVDEAQHTAAESYTAIVEWFQARLLGLTATPTRSDGKSLSLIYQSVAHEYLIRSAIRDGYLVPIRRRIVPIPGLDLSKVRGGADFTDEELASVMDTDPLVAAVAARIVEGVGSRPTMVFSPSVAHARRLAAAIDRLTRPGCALAVDGTARREERDAALGEFRSRRCQFLCSVALYTEGFDESSVEAIALARPTRFDGLFTQIVGRGLRLSAGKRDVLVLEITGTVASGKKLVSTLDILGYDETAAVRRRAAQLLDRDPALDCCAALDRAAAEGGRVAVAGQAPVRASSFDGLSLALRLDGMVLLPATPGAAPANSVQRGELKRAGIDRVGLDICQAQKLLEGLRWRSARRLSSPKQAAVLARFGYEGDCSAGEAGRIMGKLFAGGAAGGGSARQTRLGGIR